MLSIQKIFQFPNLHNLEACLQVQREVELDKIHQLEYTVEILTEKIKSLKLELAPKNQEL